MEAISSSETSVDIHRITGVISQKMELFKNKIQFGNHNLNCLSGVQKALIKTRINLTSPEFHPTDIQKFKYSSVGMATGYGIRLPTGAREFSLLHSILTDYGTYQDSYPMDTGVSFTKGRA
jgi:hypothetical protein